jgi:hypothetical protein
MHYPPWRKPEYMRANWLSLHVRAGNSDDKAPTGAARLPATAGATAVSAGSSS